MNLTWNDAAPAENVGFTRLGRATVHLPCEPSPPRPIPARRVGRGLCHTDHRLAFATGRRWCERSERCRGGHPCGKVSDRRRRSRRDGRSGGLFWQEPIRRWWRRGARRRRRRRPRWRRHDGLHDGSRLPDDETPLRRNRGHGALSLCGVHRSRKLWLRKALQFLDQGVRACLRDVRGLSVHPAVLRARSVHPMRGGFALRTQCLRVRTLRGMPVDGRLSAERARLRRVVRVPALHGDVPVRAISLL
jgi:hypothetical protein